MPIDKNLNFEISSPENYNDNIFLEDTLLPFSPVVLDFIKDVSDEILSNSFYKNYPQLMTVAFWMRKNNILKLKNNFNEQKNSDSIKMPRGVVFHITPSNVDTIFVYSWFLSMLVGNINILKISRKKSEQIKLLLEVINEIAKKEEYKSIRDRFLIIRYANEKEVTSYFSSHCDMRVIWGGDKTINAVRSISLPPCSNEITFPDRFSYTVINAEKFLHTDKQERFVDDFVKDAYSFDQNACSSPRVVFWLGNKNTCEEARKVFWKRTEEKMISLKIEINSSTIMDKFVVENILAIDSEDIRVEIGETNLINRILFKSLNDINRDIHTGGGLFFEYITENLDCLIPFVSRNDQTLSYFGFDKTDIINFIEANNLQGINRVVPVGKALDFSETWDGFRLLSEFSREIEVL